MLIEIVIDTTLSSENTLLYVFNLAKGELFSRKKNYKNTTTRLSPLDDKETEQVSALQHLLVTILLFRSLP